MTAATAPGSGLDTVSPLDWGLLYGYGVFETMHVRWGRPLFLDEHVGRMLASAAALGIRRAPPAAHVLERAQAFAGGFDDRVMRLTLTAGNPDVDLPPSLILTDRAVPYTSEQRSVGAAVAIANTVRDERSMLVRHKTLNQLQNALAWHEAQRRGFLECVFRNTSEYIAEGSRSNVFVVVNDEAITPPEDAGILPGITRQLIIGLLRLEGIIVREAPVAADMLFSCDECFLTSSVMGVMPVTRIEDRLLRPPAGRSVTAIAAAAYVRTIGTAADAARK